MNTVAVPICEDQAWLPEKKNVREFYDPHSWPLEYWLVLDTPLPMFFMSYQVLQTAMQSHKEEEPF